MVRALLYTLLGWVLLASVAGLGHSFDLTVMLPATSAVLLAHQDGSATGPPPRPLT